MTAPAWKVSEVRNPEIAQLLRGCLRFEQRLASDNPWLPFPASVSAFSFGTDGQPLPIGALFLLWRNCPGVTTTCTACGGRVLGCESFVGFLSSGIISGVCVDCTRGHSQWIAGLGAIHKLIGPHLKGTEFRVRGGSLGGGFKGRRAPLWHALYKLGERDLPAREWLRSRGANVTMRIGKKRVRFDFGVRGNGGRFL
jgi:hypothetical protein